MALFLYRLGLFSYRRRWLVVSLWLAVLVAVGGSAAAFHGTLSKSSAAMIRDTVDRGVGSGAACCRTIFW